MKKLLLHITLVLFAACASAQGSFQATLDSSQSTVATPFTITLEANVPGAERIEIQAYPEEDTSGFIILKTEDIQAKSTGESLNWKGKVWMLGIEEGLSEIPPLRAVFFGKNNSVELKSNPLQITLRPALVDTTKELKPIMGPRDAPYTFREFLPYIVIVLFLVGIAFLIWYFTKSRKKPGLDMAVELPPDPPIVIARKKLAICRQKALWKKEQYKAHYSAVTEILREYIERRLELPALESTSYETINMLKKSPLDKEAINQLDTFFKEADMVKFAKEPATEESSISLLGQAESWLGSVHEKLDPVKEEGGDDD